MSERILAIGVRRWPKDSQAGGAILGGAIPSPSDLTLAVETARGDVADGETTLAAVRPDGRLTAIRAQGTRASSHA